MTKHASISRVTTVALGVLLIASIAAQAQPVLEVKSNRVGIGTNGTPESKLEVKSSAGDAKILVNETSANSGAELFELRNNGSPFFIFKNVALGQSYSFSMGSTGNWNLSHQQTPGVQFKLTPTGNLTILGTLTQGSSRLIKDNIVPVESALVLERVLELPLATWHYTNDDSGALHLGPMAEDFRAAFGLGTNDRSLAPSDVAGAALAAVKGLHQVVQEKGARIAELEARLGDLESMVSSLAGR